LEQNHSIRDRGFKPLYFEVLWDSSGIRSIVALTADLTRELQRYIDAYAKPARAVRCEYAIPMRRAFMDNLLHRQSA